MATVSVRRKLTAILNADVQGYSRLMGEDEEATVRTLTAYREVMTSLIQQFRGRVVDTAGDNLLAEFASVVDAVQCAVEIQRLLRVKNAELAQSRRMEFRIGINLGDVIEEGDRIYGDGVNIAARIESLAEPGGICISGSAYEHIEDKLPLRYNYLGEHKVKNIAKPIRVYKAQMEFEAAMELERKKRFELKRWRRAAVAVAAILLVGIGAITIWNTFFRPADRPSEVSSVKKFPFPLPIEPSIAVMPFENLSGDPQQENIADGISESVIAALSKIPAMIVSSRSSAFVYKTKRVKVQQAAQELGVRHVLEGSVLKSGNKLRITAQLIDAVKGHHLWTEQYERDIVDLFGMLDEITNKIVVELQVKLSLGEQLRMWAEGTNNAEAWRYVSESLALPLTKKDNARARDLLTQAVKIDPNYAAAWASIALTHLVDDAFEWTASPGETYKQAYQAIQETLKIDEKNPLAHALLGVFHNGKGQRGKALAEGEKAISLGPKNALVHFFYAIIMKDAEQPEEAVSLIKKAMTLEPYYDPIYLAFLAEVYQRAGRNEEAFITLKKLLERSRKGEEAHFLALRGLAIVCTELGYTDEARTYAQALFRIKPNLSLSGVAHAMNLYKDRRQLERFWRALRRAEIKPPFLTSPEEFKHQGPPAFTLKYPKGKIETEFVLPEKVFKVKAHEGLIDFNVFVEDIPESIPLKDVGPKALLPRLEKDVGAKISLLSNEGIELEDGTKAYKTKMEFRHRKGFFITCFLISAYKESKWVYNLAATVGDPKEIESMAESLRFTPSEISIRGDIQHVHMPNNISETHIDIFVTESFPGKLPDSIDTITVTGPAGELPISKKEFRWVPQFNAFWIGMLGAPKLGTYTFAVRSAHFSGMASDTQSVIRILPRPDTSTFSPSKGQSLNSRTPRFSWGKVEADVPISYMLEIREIWDTSIYMTDYTKGMLSYTVPADALIPGKSYIWRVRVADSYDWVEVQNITWSEWLNFTMAKKLN